MKKHIQKEWILLISIMLFGAASLSSESYEEINKAEKAIQLLHELIELPEEGIPEALLNKAYGIAVIPGVFKAAYVVGGQYGKGILMIRGKDGAWSNPCFIKIMGGSYGYQIGVSKSDIILVFKSKESLEGITKGKFTLGADAGISAGPVGRRAEGSTDFKFEAEIYSYSKSKGIFAGVSVQGSSIQIDHEANADFYGTCRYSPRDILEKKYIPSPPVAGRLRAVLSKYTDSPMWM
jgi:lipid-binding SYLF domain-containing protein